MENIELELSLNEYNVEVSKRYYNNGEQEGLLGATGTLQGVQKLNDFIKKYGTDFVYPEDMSSCFLGYDGERIPLLELNPNTSNVTNMQNLFYGCRLKSIPAINTQNVTDMSFMFRDCNKLSSVPVLDTSNVSNMSDMFFNCNSLVSVPLLNTGNVTDMNNMFWGCTSLAIVPMLDASKTRTIYSMFRNCSSLITLGGLKNLGMGYGTGWTANSNSLTLNLSDSPLLTHDSLMNVINNLYDIKSKGVKTQTLQLGNTNKAKLTTEEIAIATNKGWNVI